MSTVASSGEIREIQLIQKAARGDGDAFALLFEKHFETIYNYVLWLCNDPDHAEDLTQETFIRAHGSLKQLGPPWRIRPWLYRMAHNLFIDHARQRKPVHPLDPDAPLASSEDNPERQLMFEELSGPVHGALVRLSPNYREALVLREVQGFHYSDIAEIMGVSVDHVKVLLHRARASFKDNYGLRLLVEKPMPQCSVLNEMMDAWRDKELTPEQEAAVREHVKDCASCQQRKRELAALVILFKAQPLFKLPETLRQSLLNPGGQPASPATSGPKTGPAKPGPKVSPAKDGKKAGRLIAAGMLGGLMALAAWLIIHLPGLGGGADVGAPPLGTPTSTAGGFGGGGGDGGGPSSPANMTPVGVCTCGDGVCNVSCENTDLCSQDCTCNFNAVCEPGEGFNCPDCAPTPFDGGSDQGGNSGGNSGGNRGGSNPTRCPCTCVASRANTCSVWRNECTGAVGKRPVCR